MKKIFLQICALFLLTHAIIAQVEFNTSNKEFMYNMGAGNATIYRDCKSASAKAKDCQKLYITGEYLGKNIEKINHFPNLQLALFDTVGLAHIPGSIGDLSQLFVLSIKNNKIIYIDPRIGNLSSLMLFELVGTKLDSIPKSFVGLSNLELFRLINNEADTLKIPAE